MPGLAPSAPSARSSSWSTPPSAWPGARNPGSDQAPGCIRRSNSVSANPSLLTARRLRTCGEPLLPAKPAEAAPPGGQHLSGLEDHVTILYQVDEHEDGLEVGLAVLLAELQVAEGGLYHPYVPLHALGNRLQPGDGLLPPTRAYLPDPALPWPPDPAGADDPAVGVQVDHCEAAGSRHPDTVHHAAQQHPGIEYGLSPVTSVWCRSRVSEVGDLLHGQLVVGRDELRGGGEPS